MNPPWINIPVIPSRHVIIFKNPINKTKENDDRDAENLPNYMADLSQFLAAIEDKIQTGHKIKAQYIEMNAPEPNTNQDENHEIGFEQTINQTESVEETKEPKSLVEDLSVDQQVIDFQASCQIQPSRLTPPTGGDPLIEGTDYNSVTPTEPDENDDEIIKLESEQPNTKTEFVEEAKETWSLIEYQSVDHQDMSTPDPFKISPVPTAITDADPPIIGAGTYNRIDNYEQGKGCFMTKKIPFSVYVEIDDFLHNPICGEVAQNTFEFHDQPNQKFPVPDMDTKLLHTTTYYPEQPDYRLVFSEINEMVFVKNAQNDSKTNRSHSKAMVLPLHDASKKKTGKSDDDAYMHIRVPVVLGEYKVEITLEDNFEFPEDMLRVKKITKEIILTNFRLIPTVFTPSNDGTRTAQKGILLIEGYILQKIEYTASQNRSKASIAPITLGQKMVVELIIHILQTQKIKIPFL